MGAGGVDPIVMAPQGACSINDLASWGLLEAVERERRRDQLMAGVPMPPGPVLEVLRTQWAERNGLNAQHWCERSGLGLDVFNRLVSRAWRWQRWCEEKFASSLPSYYLRRKSELDQVSFWLLEVHDGDLAAEFYQRLRGREVGFEQLAVDLASGNEGRVLHRGPTALADLPQQQRAVLAGLQEGTLLAPRLVGSAWQLLYLESRQAAALTPDLRCALLQELGEAFLRSRPADPD